MKKRMPFTRYSNCRFTHLLLAACLLADSAIATIANATPTILATNQYGAGYIIVDGSRVYWINYDNSAVSSVDKLYGGPIRIHNPANNSAPGGAIVQDVLNIYFASETGTQGLGNWNLYSATKFSSVPNVTQLTFDTNNTETSTSGSGPALAISYGSLYYFGGFQEINCPGSPNYNPNYPANCGLNRTIKKISTQGGASTQVIPLASNPDLDIGPDYFDTDSGDLHWSDVLLNAILRVPLIGGIVSGDAVTDYPPGALRTPTTGPAGGYHFWIEGAPDPNALLRGQTPGGAPFTLLTGVINSGYNSFVQVDFFVYCATFNGIVRVPITGGTPAVVVDPLDSLAPAGLTSDGTYLYWTAAGDGSIRRFPLNNNSPRFDFNGDNKPDYVLYNAGTRQSAIWYLNNNVYIGGGYAPTLPVGWMLVDVADFNGDGHPDYAQFNPSTHQTAVWYLNNRVYVGGGYGPTLPGGWQLVALGDFNGDGKPDYALFNPSTRQTAIWYLNNRVYVGGGYGPTLPIGWQLMAVGDFNGDGHPDYVLYNPGTRQTAIWYLNNRVYVSGALGPTIAGGYVLSGVADFNSDGKPDYVLYNASNRVTAIWYLNNNVYIGGAYGPTLPVGWSLAAP